jgi:hypothetical protein
LLVYKAEYKDTEMNISKISWMAGGSPEIQKFNKSLETYESELSRESRTFCEITWFQTTRLPLNIVQNEHDIMQPSLNAITVLTLRRMR